MHGAPHNTTQHTHLPVQLVVHGLGKLDVAIDWNAEENDESLSDGVFDSGHGACESKLAFSRARSNDRGDAVVDETFRKSSAKPAAACEILCSGNESV